MKTTTGMTMVVVAGVLLVCFGPSASAALPPDPNNAALLYYQAFLLTAQTDDRAAKDLVLEVATGKVAPNDQVKAYVNKCRDALDYAATASNLPHCDWGLVYSRGFSALLPHLAQARSLAWLILADGRILAAEGNYRQALERCVSVYRMAGQLGDDVLVSVLVSAAITAQANKGVTAILERMPADAGTLTWLKGQLAAMPVATLGVEKSMAVERQVTADYMRPQRREELIKVLVESVNISEAGRVSEDEIRKTATDTALQRAREYYANYMDSALVVLTGPMPYAEGYAKLQELTKRAEQDAAKDPAVHLFRAAVPAMAKMYNTQVRHQADLHALQAAIDVYLAKAATGRVPGTLPAASPRDPYTGGQFKYEVTANGFVLRSGAKDLDKNEVREYRFVTPK